MTSGHVLRLVPHQVKDRTGHLLLKGPSSPTDTQPADSRGRFNRARCSLCTSHWATSSYSPPLTVEILGPVGDIKLLVSLTSLLPPPLGSLVGSWLWPLLAHNFCEDILADRSPVSSLWPQGTPLEPGTRKTLLATLCRHLHTQEPDLESSAGRRGRTEPAMAPCSSTQPWLLLFKRMHTGVCGCP